MKIPSAHHIQEQGKPQQAIPWQDCLAKSNPQKGVLRHSIECGAVYEALLKAEDLPESSIGRNTALFALAHDCGKISPRFQFDIGQTKCPLVLLETKEKRHEVISEVALEDYLGDRRDDAAKIVGWHHGKHKDPGYPANAIKFGGPAWQEQRRAFLERIAEFAEHVPKQMTNPAILLTAGMVCIADWISSDENNFKNDLTASFVEMKKEAERIVQRIGWRCPELKPGLAFRDVFPFEPNEAQKRLCEAATGPGIYVLENTMGAGKTEAALYAAYRLISSGANRGLFFALPTRLTSNKIYERVQAFLKAVSVEPQHTRLIHGSAWLEASGGKEMAPGKEWFAPSKRALLEPFGVGTIDQALKGVLNVKHFFVRLAGLAGKVIIIDEAHSYDAYMFYLLKNLCHILVELNCTVIVLSATLPFERRAELLGQSSGQIPPVTYPRLTLNKDGTFSQSGLMPSRRTTVNLRCISPESVVAEAIRAARNGCNTAIIVNTVQDAQALFRQIKSEMLEEEFPVGLLHSRFPPWRRNEIESFWLGRLGKTAGPDRPRGSILVSTQIIEQSVDLDFDFMISEMVPSDLMFQRMGRLWRHNRPERPCEAPVFCWSDHGLRDAKSAKDVKTCAGSNSYIYAPWLLLRSERIWSVRDSVVVPDHMDEILEFNYNTADPADEVERELLRELNKQVQSKTTTARTASQLSLSGQLTVSGDDSDEAATRLSDYPQMPVLLVLSLQNAGSDCALTLSDGTRLSVILNEKFDIRKMRAFAENMANIPLYWLDKSERKSDLPDPLKNYWKYDAPVILQIAEDGTLVLTNGTETMIHYDNDFGISRKQKMKGDKTDETHESDW